MRVLRKIGRQSDNAVEEIADSVLDDAPFRVIRAADGSYSIVAYSNGFMSVTLTQISVAQLRFLGAEIMSIELPSNPDVIPEEL